MSVFAPFHEIRRLNRQPHWIELFEDVANRKLGIRAAWKTFEVLRGTLLGDCMVGGLALVSYLRTSLPSSAGQKHTTSRIAAVWAYENERREIERVAELLKPGNISVDPVSLSPLGVVSTASFRSAKNGGITLKGIKRVLRIIRRMSKREHFLVICQSASVLGSYARFRRDMELSPPDAILVASGSHPVVQSLVAAAKSCSIPSIYCTHATVAPRGRAIVPQADLVLLDGPAALDACAEVGPIAFQVVYKGLPGGNVPLNLNALRDPNFAVGIFISAPVDQSGLRAAVLWIKKQLQPKHILIRPHPVAMLSPDLTPLVRDVPEVTVMTGATLDHCIEQCSLVFSGNSNVHLDVLKAGVPTAFMPRLDTTVADYYGFVAGRIVPGFDTEAQINIQAIIDFYSGTWPERFRKFDVAYLEAPEVAAQRVCEGVSNFLQSSSLRESATA